jgi:hypothetical protein
MAAPGVWLAWPHRASAPSKRFPYRSAAMCVAPPPIDWPVTYVRAGRPYLRAKRSQRAAVSSAARPGISEVLLKLDAPQAKPWPIRYLRMPGGVTSVTGRSSP